ncbi:helix-turn-helix transcriptional regulator [Cohnella cholangitidis]|uniref:YafY family transcriptional regulator n=1 Tax=Cohnella cholangitidis TaxID=2598458 RepID=A0A7G5C0A6_9BACL|nr:YafY family protein [Cohnella cholangitidis]QMV42640.1 YafY family transcriptional regulator [Cohnella cholangitidis]
MKINRLLGIVIYLLNRDTVSARSLAEKFEVSTRTIQRDIETLSLAGIPVGAEQGTNGGYYIMNSFKMNRQVLHSEDYTFILTALKGLCSGYSSNQAEATFEKMLALSPYRDHEQQSISLDFGVLREGARTREDIAIVERAIRMKYVIEFEYTNALNDTSNKLVEPLTLTYKWYSWYVFGFCRRKQDYRLFRLSRMRRIESTVTPFSKHHENAEALLARHQDQRPYINVKLLCSSEIRVSIEESFPNARLTEIGEKEFVIEFSVPEEEKGWFGTLLGYGRQVAVLEPESLKQKVISHAKSILDRYC